MLLDRLARAAFAPRDIASLAVFRVGFGLFLAFEAAKHLWRGWIDAFYVKPTLLFPYWGFEWVRPLPGPALEALMVLLTLAGLGVALGWRYRLCAATYALGFTYVFLLERANYLNHYYFMCLLALLMTLAPAHRALSLDARRDPALASDHAPAWSLWLLRFQVGVVYVGAGIAKLDPDWLLGIPFGLCLRGHQDTLVGALAMKLPHAGMLLATAGLLFDLLVVPGVMWRRTRPLFLLGATAFHLTNASLFPIGIFPWLMLWATLLLLPPDWPRSARLLGPAPIAPPPATPRPAVLAALAAYVTLQLLLPLRGWLYPGDPSWTGQGHFFAWRMMLVNKQPVDARFLVREPSTGRQWLVHANDYLTGTQIDALSWPQNLPALCRRIRSDFEARGHPGVAVHADVQVSLNGRQAAPLVDSAVDLAAVEDGLGHARWILLAPGKR